MRLEDKFQTLGTSGTRVGLSFPWLVVDVNLLVVWYVSNQPATSVTPRRPVHVLVINVKLFR